MIAHRKAVERLYRDKVTIVGYAKEKRKGATEVVEKKLFTNIPCKVSLRIQRAPIQSDYATVDYDAKLFVAPEIDVPENSKVIVTDVNGRVSTYYAGKAFGYVSHQEIYMNYSEKVMHSE